VPKRRWSIAFVIALGAIGVSHAAEPAPPWVIPLTSYLGKAEALLDAGHPWQDTVRTARADFVFGHRESAAPLTMRNTVVILRRLLP